MPQRQLHPVIAKLQGDTDPTNAVKELMQGASIIAQSVGVKVQYTVESADPSATPDSQIWHVGVRHIHSAIAMIGVRARNVLTNAINKTRKLPHVPVNTAPSATNSGAAGSPPEVGQTGN